MKRMSAAAALLAIASLWGTEDPELRVERYARSLQPGEVVAVEVSSREGLDLVTGSLFDKPLSFFKADGRWLALAGIDLNAQPREYVAEIEAAAAMDEGPLATVLHLRVLPKQFPTRYLTVEPRFVEPPPEMHERIERESTLQHQILAHVSGKRLWEGPFRYPVPAHSTSSFGKRSVFNGQPRSPHTGADFDAAEGTPIHAPAAGTVVLARELYFAGNTVIIDHGLGLYSLLAHLSRFSVQEGEAVEAGQVVGLVGATGRVTGPHLHWSIALNQSRVDPVSLIEVTRQVFAQE